MICTHQNTIRVIRSRRMRWARHVARIAAKIKVYRILVVNPTSKRTTGRPSYRWECNIKIYVQ